MNDVSIKGQTFMRLGIFDRKGNMYHKGRKGGPLKKYCTHVVLRFADKKWFREAGLPQSFWEMPREKASVEKFFTEIDA